MKDNAFLVESVKKLLRRGATSHLLNILQKVRAADLAEAFNSLDESEQASVFHLLAEKANHQAALLLGELHPSLRTDLLSGREPAEVARVLQNLPSDDVAEILALGPQEERERILSLMQKEASEQVQNLLEYEEETAGRIMTTRFFALPEEFLVRDAITAVQKAQEAEMVFYLFVVDEHDHLQGVLSLRRLLTVPPDTHLREIMSTNVISVRTGTDQEEVAKIATRYDLLAVPVVNDENALVGIVTIDDVMDVIREEATEDFYKLAGTSDEERMMKSTLQAASVRLPWMFAAFLGGLLAAMLIKRYTPLLSQSIMLVCFIPVVLGMGGNIGTQAATIMVRGLATGRISLRQVGGVIFREIRIALLLGILYGTFLGVAAVVLVDLSVRTGLVVGAALLLSMSLAAIVGSVFPMLLKAVHIDPAVATSPFVTTSVDLLGLLAYFGLAGPYLIGR